MGTLSVGSMAHGFGLAQNAMPRSTASNFAFMSHFSLAGSRRAFASVCSMQHIKARGLEGSGEKYSYPGTEVKRSQVPDEYVRFDKPWSDYKPVEYTASSVLAGPVWADNDDASTISFNRVDGKVDRVSFTGEYKIDVGTGRPLNPVGRTGMTGRGLLGRWGPNHAADPVVTRFVGGKLQFIAIKRKDGGGWAIPGGMVEAGETVSLTLKREFGEEAMDLNGKSKAEADAIMQKIDDMFAHGVEIYKGYVDDPRNTDNAWMETVAMNFHLDDSIAETITLQAGDDAGAVSWMDIVPDLKLYASHKSIIEEAAKMHDVMI
eukprot:767714-Hanusia_phi.AAC.1